MRTLIIILFALLFSNCFAQSDKMSISGIVINGQTKQPLPYANISIEEANFGSISDDKGHFIIELDHKNYELTFSYLGFQTISLRDLSKYILPSKGKPDEPYMLLLNPDFS